VLPRVIDDVLIDREKFSIKNSVFEELEQIDKNLLKNLYLLSFRDYKGFNNLNI
jgi:hypothetical protein